MFWDVGLAAAVGCRQGCLPPDACQNDQTFPAHHSSASLKPSSTNSLPGFVSAGAVKALAFSPGFPEDGALVTVTETNDKKVMLQVFNLTSQAWNTQAGLADYPVTVVGYGESGQLDSASIALPPDYLASKEHRRTAFVGLAVRNDKAGSAFQHVMDRMLDFLFRFGIH